MRLSYWLAWEEKGDKDGSGAFWPRCEEEWEGIKPGWTMGAQPTAALDI